MVRVGIVGIGFMGMIHYLAYQKVRGAKVTAICSRDERKLSGDWRGIKGNFGPPGAKMDLGPIARYADWRELIRDPQVDLVDVCLPPALHAEVAVAALKAGKHVLVEKPIALETVEAQRMVRAAREAERLLLIAQVLPFNPEYAFAYDAVTSGRYGKLLGGHFKRVISDATWIKDVYDPKTVGGPVVDLHIHDAHFIRLLCGMPKSVFSTGRVEEGTVRFVNSQFLFDDGGPSVTASSGVINQQGRSYTHAFEIYLERATLLFDFAVLDGEAPLHAPLTVLTRDGKVKQPKLSAADGFVAELSEAARCVKAGRASPLLSGELACDALKLCHKQIDSVKSGRIVKV